MIIGIDGSRAFVKQRTGIEEYSYRVIGGLKDRLNNHQVVLYLKKDQQVDFTLPNNWKIKIIRFSRLWTQLGLSLELWRNPVSSLFISAHTIPFIHPKNTIVVIHGLEYEITPEAYSFWDRLYMRISIKKSCYWAKTIVAVSKNTKKDLIELYKISENKIRVIYEGVSSVQELGDSGRYEKYRPYLLFVGRLEKRKNIEGIISAFEILKEKYKIPHKLILAGSTGFGYLDIKLRLENSKYKNEIIETGFISEKEKNALMQKAEIFLFPSFYEGFGLPILEAQKLGIPVVTSNISSMPEIGGDSVAYCDPNEVMSLVFAIQEIIKDNNFKDAIIRKGYKNVDKFSWEKCVREIAKIINLSE